jgi:hypothetical protein
VRLDDSDDRSTDSRGNVGADDEVLREFWEIALPVPKMNIGANIDERFGRVADGITELLKFEDAAVDVVAVVHRNITVDGLGRQILGGTSITKVRGQGWEKDEGEASSSLESES